MKVGDLVQANKFANWSARQARIGLVLDVIQSRDNIELTAIRVILGGKIKVLPANHFEVAHEAR